MIIFAMPSVALASSMLISDRLVGTNFYNQLEHGDALLWQHLFWFFGHPEVYIIFLPATGFVSVIIETFCRRPVFAYPVVVLALISTGILAFGLWVHHMFATGLPRVGYSFYTAASMTVAIPTGLQIFCWLATMWDGRPRFQVPMLYVVGFIVTFVIGGLTGVIIAAVPLDLAAPRHLLHRRALPLRADRRRGVPAARHPHLLVPQDHRPDDERDARQDQLLDGVPRLPAGLLPDALRGPARACRGASTPIRPGLGSSFRTCSRRSAHSSSPPRSLLFVINGIVSLYRGAIAPPNPWGASTLEWATQLAAAALQFRARPGRRKPARRCGTSTASCRSSPAFASTRRRCC